jgi:hypothetical protein
MTEDFFDDVINDELEIESFDGEDNGDEDDDVEDDEDVESRSVVLFKEDMIAILGLKGSSQGGLIIRVDPRQKNPAAQTYDDALAATKWFNRSLKTSRKNGWKVIYDGTPAFG